MPMFQPQIETMPREELRALQLAKLKKQVEHAYNDVPFYKKQLDERGVRPEHIKTLKDVALLPLTTKEELRQNYPFGMFGVPQKDVVRIHASSGTTGKPTVVGYTKQDLDVWSDCVARFCAAVGVTAEDTAQISFGYGLFTGALGLHMGLEKLGASVIPISSGNTDKQLMLMEDFGTTVLIATPSYALYLAEAIHERGLADRLKLKIGLFGSECCTPEMRAQIEKHMNVFATDNYGLSECGGPGMSGECHLRNGLHINEDHFLCEILDANTFEPVEEGEKGELVITCLSKQCLPVLRYRTKDITSIDYSPCACGRTFARMAKVTARTDDMLIIKGVNVFPSQIESVLMGMEGVAPHYQLVLRKKRLMDTLEVKVELGDSASLERFAELETLQRNIHDRLKSVLGLECKVTLVEPGSLERFQGKAKRVLDLRNEENA
ncbi:MAG: phenylacetate--CoA ligase [Ruminococcaceae bacterium]|nr:phenylacetate--CoA ligase [Oscillospiraceae bacterium]